MFIILSWVRVSQCICTWLLVVSVRRLGLISCPSLQAGVLDHLWGVSSICWGSGVLDSHRSLRVCTHSYRTNYTHSFLPMFNCSPLARKEMGSQIGLQCLLLSTSSNPPRNLTSDLRFAFFRCIPWQFVFVRDQVVTKCFCKRCVVDTDLCKIFPQKYAIKIFESPPTPSPYTMLWATGVTKMRGTKRSKRPQHCVREGREEHKKIKTENNQKRKSEVKFWGGLKAWTRGTGTGTYTSTPSHHHTMNF